MSESMNNSIRQYSLCLFEAAVPRKLGSSEFSATEEAGLWFPWQAATTEGCAIRIGPRVP